MAFKFISDTDIKPYKGSIVFQASGSTAVIKARFRHMRQTVFSDWRARECTTTSTPEEMALHALEVLDSWSDITDQSDNPLTMDLGNLSDLFDRYPSAYVGLVKGYERARFTAEEKN